MSLGLKHIKTLDGLRGIAILMVFLFHAFIQLPSVGHPRLARVTGVGSLGVDLFFCLSGFLITGILYETRFTQRYFTNFYARRALRIFPLYYSYLLLFYFFVIVLHRLRHGGVDIGDSAQDIHWVWFYATNILIAIHGEFISPSLNHFWTLAVEEHFYLLWPLMVYRLRTKNLISSAAFLSLAALILRALLQHHNISAMVIETLTPCRIDSFLIAGCASILIRNDVWYERLARHAPKGIVISLFFALLTGLVWPNLFLTIGYMSIAFGFTLLITCAVIHRDSLSFFIFRSRPLTFCGKYSYALYVFHWPIQVAFFKKYPLLSLEHKCGSLILALVLDIAVVGGLSVAMSLISWNICEKHFLKLKKYFVDKPSVGDTMTVDRFGIKA